MELRHHGMLKVIVGFCLLSLAAYTLASWNGGEEWGRTRTQYAELSAQGIEDEDPSAMERSYSVSKVAETTEDEKRSSLVIEDEEQSVLQRSYSVSDGVKPCPCRKRTFHGLEAPEGVDSLCSEGATARGHNQKVVAFNFYGETKFWRPYFPGIRTNALLLPTAYPGWTMRVYHDLPAGHEVLCDLTCEFPHLDLCDSRRIPGYGDISNWQKNAWRFFPIGDPLVDMAMFRDLDGEITDREVAAVDQWLDSDLTFHVMRDLEPHRGREVLAGMWGVRVSQRRVQLKFFLPLVANITFSDNTQDQVRLKNHLWPVMKGDVMQHDSYGCVKFSEHGNMKPFPTRRSETDILNWVGARKNIDEEPALMVCPEECRPPDHKDWIYC